MIKYHDNIHGKQYGDDLMLTDNWESAAVYGENEYINVHFRINCPTYAFTGRDYSFATVEQRDDFYSEAQAILRRFAVPEGLGGRYGGFPMEHLYIHPQDISGVVAKNKVRPMAEAMNECATFSTCFVDLYEDISPMSNAEYLDGLKAQREQIEREILDAFKTKRSNLYIVGGYGNSPLISVLEKHFVPRREAERANDDGVGYSYIMEVFHSLVAAGKIVCANTKSGTGYRTAKKNEIVA